MNKKFSRHWSEEQEKNLIEMYPDASMAAMEYIIGKPRAVINNKAKDLGLERSQGYKERHKHRGPGKQRDTSPGPVVKVSQKIWTEDEVKKMISMKARRMPIKKIAENLGRSARSVAYKWSTLNETGRIKKDRSIIVVAVKESTHADTLPASKRQMMKKFMQTCNAIESTLNRVSNNGK